MEKYIKIEFYGTGYVMLNVESFFPCSVKTFKQVLKFVDEDFRNREDIIDQLAALFMMKIAECKHEIENAQYDGYLKQKTAELKKWDRLNKLVGCLYESASSLRGITRGL